MVVFTGTINGDAILEVQVLNWKCGCFIQVGKNGSEVETKKSPHTTIGPEIWKMVCTAVITLWLVLCFRSFDNDRPVKKVFIGH